MGADPEARLAYGYNLGTAEDPAVAERGEYGGFTPIWLNTDNEDNEGAGFVELAEARLLASVGFTETDWQADGYYNRKKAAEAALGVEIQWSGTYEYPGYVLAITASNRSVEWSDVMVLDLNGMSDPANLADWDAKLAAAVAALGLTPKQDRPRWLVFPFYG